METNTIDPKLQVQLEKLDSKQLADLMERKKAEEKAEKEKREREYEKLKDEFVKATAAAFIHYSAELTNMKDYASTKASELQDKMYDIYGKEKKDHNQFSIEDSNGLLKIVVQRKEKYSFNEKAIIHIDAIKDVFRAKFERSNKRMYAVMETLLVKGKDGEYDPKLLTKLNKHRDDVNSPAFNEALDELAKCYSVTGESNYIQAMRRREVDGKWEAINIQFSAL